MSFVERWKRYRFFVLLVIFALHVIAMQGMLTRAHDQTDRVMAITKRLVEKLNTCEADWTKLSLEHFCEDCKARRVDKDLGSNQLECVRSVLDWYGTKIIDDCDTGLSVEIHSR